MRRLQTLRHLLIGSFLSFAYAELWRGVGQIGDQQYEVALYILRQGEQVSGQYMMVGERLEHGYLEASVTQSEIRGRLGDRLAFRGNLNPNSLSLNISDASLGALGSWVLLRTAL